jgi:hypothetical protein
VYAAISTSSSLPFPEDRLTPLVEQKQASNNTNTLANDIAAMQAVSTPLLRRDCNASEERLMLLVFKYGIPEFEISRVEATLVIRITCKEEKEARPEYKLLTILKSRSGVP